MTFVVLLTAGCAEERRPEPRVASETQTTKKSVASQCEGRPCLPTPTGLKGLSFGMNVTTIADVLKAQPENLGAVYAQPNGEFKTSRTPVADAVKMPGAALEVDTSLGGDAATCRLDLGASMALVGMTCEIKGDSSRRYAKIRESLVRQYGPPHDDGPSSARWQSSNASLVLTDTFLGVELENLSTTRLDALAAAALKAKTAEKERNEAAQREIEARDRARQDELDRDLGTAAERPN